MKAKCSTRTLVEKISMKIAREIEKPNKRLSKKLFMLPSQSKAKPLLRFSSASNVPEDKEDFHLCLMHHVVMELF